MHICNNLDLPTKFVMELLNSNDFILFLSAQVTCDVSISIFF